MGIQTSDSIAKEGRSGIHLLICLKSDYNFLIPYQAEAYQCAEPGDEATHGTSGPLKISLAQDEINIGNHFLAVAAECDKKRGSTKDVNNSIHAMRMG